MHFMRYGQHFVLAILVLVSTISCKHQKSEKELAEEQKPFLQKMQRSARWKERARAFDKHKVTAATIFRGATKVEGFRLLSNENETVLGKVGEFSYTAKSTDQNSSFADRLGKLILDPHNDPGPGESDKQCYIDPGLVFRVWKGKQFVDVILCFECNQLVVFENDPHVPTGTVGGWLKGRFYIQGDFDTFRPALIALVQEAFPGDPVFSKM